MTTGDTNRLGNLESTQGPDAGHNKCRTDLRSQNGTPQTTERTLLVLPLSPLIDCAKAVLKTIVGLLYRTAICQRTGEVGTWFAT